MCKKQSSISLITAKVEYISAQLGCAKIFWLQHILKIIGLEMKGSSLYCDSSSAISITKNPIFPFRTKHIEVKCHFIREHMQDRGINIKYVPTGQQLGDIFTKPLGEERYLKLRKSLGH